MYERSFRLQKQQIEVKMKKSIQPKVRNVGVSAVVVCVFENQIKQLGN